VLPPRLLHHDVIGADRVAVFLAIGGVEFVVDLAVDVNERHVLVDFAGLDMTLVPYLGAAKPRGATTVDRSGIDVVAGPHDPDDHRITQRAVRPYRGDTHLVCGSDPVEFLAGPCRHDVHATGDSACPGEPVIPGTVKTPQQPPTDRSARALQPSSRVV
jgi:hypothetical protein